MASGSCCKMDSIYLTCRNSTPSFFSWKTFSCFYKHVLLGLQIGHKPSKIFAFDPAISLKQSNDSIFVACMRSPIEVISIKLSKSLSVAMRNRTRPRKVIFQMPGLKPLGRVLVCVFLCDGLFLFIILSDKACSSLHFPQYLARFTFPQGLFPSHVLLSQPTIFVLSLVAKYTVIGLQQHMMKILGLVHLSVTKTSAWPCFYNLCLPCFYWLLWAVNHILFPWL